MDADFSISSAYVIRGAGKQASRQAGKQVDSSFPFSDFQITFQTFGLLFQWNILYLFWITIFYQIVAAVEGMALLPFPNMCDIIFQINPAIFNSGLRKLNTCFNYSQQRNQEVSKYGKQASK